MGVSGLLPELKEIQKPANLSQFKGQTLAVDTYGWLHRGLILCAQDLCTDTPTRSYVTSVIKKVDMLRYFGVEPFMVFDGTPLPTKAATALERREKRDKARQNAQTMIKKGDRKGAWKEFMKAAGVTPEMAKSVMLELDKKHVKYVVAPYEADPQMVYLEKVGLVDGILSEDSDLLVFGCRRLITKLNEYGECVEINTDNLHEVPKLKLDTLTRSQWRMVAIISGCDYTKGVPGVGIKTAFRFVRKSESFEQLVATVHGEGKVVPKEFLSEALEADLAFQYQKVFNPVEKCVTTLNDYEEGFSHDMAFVESCCGFSFDPEIQVGICTGKLHPDSKKILLSREQVLAGVVAPQIDRSGSKTMARKATVKQVAGVKPARNSIDSFFKVDQMVVSTTQATKTLFKKDPTDPKMSPNSKKIKKFASITNSENLKSRFFSEKVPKLSFKTTEPVNQSEMDNSFLTGDSEVPEFSSSPVRQAPPIESATYLTDEDDDSDLFSTTNSITNSITCPLLLGRASKSFLAEESDHDEGYEGDFPDKVSSLGWREKFLFGNLKVSEKGSEKSTLSKCNKENVPERGSLLKGFARKKTIIDGNMRSMSTESNSMELLTQNLETYLQLVFESQQIKELVEVELVKVELVKVELVKVELVKVELAKPVRKNHVEKANVPSSSNFKLKQFAFQGY